MNGSDREAVFQKTKEIVMEVFDVDEVTPDSSLIDDLGAESIDFLDLSFKIEKEFGVKFPERGIAQLGSVVRDKRLEVIEDLLTQRFQVILSEADRQELADLDLSSVIEKLNRDYHIHVDPDGIAEGTKIVIRKIIEHLAALGFVVSDDGGEHFSDITIEDNPQKIQKKIMEWFTVQVLADFIYRTRSTRSETRYDISVA
jgi:acyl carrier protein